MWIYLLCQAEASLKTKPAFIIATPTAWHSAAAEGWGGGARWTAGQLFLDPAPRMRKALHRPVSPSPQESSAVSISVFFLFFFLKCFLYFFFLKHISFLLICILATLCGMGDGSLSRARTQASAVKAPNPNH